jgi:hypothetical protein
MKWNKEEWISIALMLGMMFVVSVAANLLTGCTQLPTTPETKPAPVPPVLEMPTLPWKNAKWDRVLYAEIEKHFPMLDKAATDMQRFCPKYKSLDHQGRVVALAHFFVALSFRESSYNPRESAVDVGTAGDRNTHSVGLFSMSQTDQKNYGLPMGYTYEDLLTYGPNIKLALAVSAKLIGNSGIIAAGCNNANSRSMAAYFSTLRTNDCGDPKYHKLAEIVAQAKKSPGCS